MERFLYTILTFLGLTAGLLLAGESVAQGPTNLEKGKAALAQGDLSSARKFLEMAYKEAPQDTAVISALTDTYLRGQDARRAEQVLTDAVKRTPTMGELYVYLGVAQNMRGNFKTAYETLQKANELLGAEQPLRSTLYLNLGIATQGLIAQETRKVDGPSAISWYDKAVELNPRNATAHSYRGSALYRAGNYEDAVLAYSKALEIDDSNAIILYNRGMAYLREGNRAKACLDFHAACKRRNMNACKQITIECTHDQLGTKLQPEQ